MLGSPYLLLHISCQTTALRDAGNAVSACSARPADKAEQRASGELTARARWRLQDMTDWRGARAQHPSTHRQPPAPTYRW